MIFYLLMKKKKIRYQKEIFNIFLVQVPIRKEVSYLSICLSINNNLENNWYIKIKKSNDNYFYLDNLIWDEYSYLENPNISFDLIIELFLETFFDNNKNLNSTYKLSLLKDIIDRISIEKVIIELKLKNLLELFKYCLDFNLELKNIKLVEKKRNDKFDIKIDYFFSNE